MCPIINGSGASTGGSQTLLDLGLVTAVSLLSGPVTLKTTVAGDYLLLNSIPAGFVALNDMNISFSRGPIDALVGGSVELYSLGNAGNGFTTWAYVQMQAHQPASSSLLRNGFQDGSPIQAVIETLSGLFVVAPFGAWQANHAYAANALISAAAHGWSANVFGAPGTSGGSVPNFAANIGGTVVDNTVTWTDEGAIPTQGSLHMTALSVPVT